MAKKSRLTEALPWYRWNPTRWQGSRKVQRMSWAQRGLYRELMDECWLKGSVPSTPAGIADLLDADAEEVAGLLPGIIRCFLDRGDGTMISEFIEEVRTEMDAMRVAAQANARKRWDAAASKVMPPHEAACEVMREEKRREENERRGETSGTQVQGLVPDPALPGQGGECELF